MTTVSTTSAGGERPEEPAAGARGSAAASSGAPARMGKQGFRRLSQPGFLLVIPVWVIGVAFGFTRLLNEAFTPGDRGNPGRCWPVGSRLHADPTRPNLVMAAHPRCPSTRASLEELAERMASVHNRVHVPVLVADDNAANRRILAEVLARWGMRPEAVESGEAALAALRHAHAAGRPYPLLLTDLIMPAMDAYLSEPLQPAQLYAARDAVAPFTAEVARTTAPVLTAR